MDGHPHYKPLTVTAYTRPGGILVFSVKKPIPPLMNIVDLAAYPCSRAESFPTQEILENGVIASWPPNGIQKADHWCTPDPHVTEPQKRPGEELFFVQWMDEEQYLSWSFLRFGDVRIGSAPMVGLLDAVGRPTGNYSILKNFLGWERFSSRAGIGGQ